MLRNKKLSVLKDPCDPVRASGRTAIKQHLYWHT